MDRLTAARELCHARGLDPGEKVWGVDRRGYDRPALREELAADELEDFALKLRLLGVEVLA